MFPIRIKDFIGQIVICLLLLFVAIDSAIANIDLLSVSDGRHLNSGIQYWADPIGVPASVALQQGEFKPLTPVKLVFGANTHWYLLDVYNPLSETLLVNLATGLPTTPKLNAYWTDHLEAPFYSVNTFSPYEARAVQYPLLFIPLRVPANTKRQLLIEHQSLANYPLALRVVREDVLHQKMSLFTLVRGLVFGALFVFLILFVVQAYSVKTRAYLFYCLYIIGLIFLVGHIFGYNFAYLWPTNGEFNQRFTSVITGFTYGCYYAFCAHLFPSLKAHSKLYWLTLVLGGLAMLLGLFNLWWDAFWLLAALALIGLPIPIIIGVWARKQQLISANLFLGGAVVHCSLSYLLALECLGVHLGYSYYLFSFLSVGQLLDLGLFSSALLRQGSQLQKALHQQLEQRLEDAKALAQAERERSQILAEQQAVALELASTTHDLNQPLAAIRFALALLKEEDSAAKTHIAHSLDYVQSLVKALTRAGREAYQDATQPIAIKEFIADVNTRHQAAFREKGLDFRMHTHVSQLHGMPVLLHRIVDNLLVNAHRYTHHGGVLLSFRKRGDNVLMQVWDTGKGMAQTQVSQLLEPFTQVQRGGEGFGLGLSIVKRLAEQAGFRFTVRSQLGKGTCIDIEMPDQKPNI